jgi:hypothetical protein
MFFHVLKNGCRVEALQPSTIQPLELALALFSGGGLADCPIDAAGSNLSGPRG